jgi:hypothetical protein
VAECLPSKYKALSSNTRTGRERETEREREKERERETHLPSLAHTCNSSTWKAEAVGSQVKGQPGLHSEIL